MLYASLIGLTLSGLKCHKGDELPRSGHQDRLAVVIVENDVYSVFVTVSVADSVSVQSYERAMFKGWP